MTHLARRARAIVLAATVTGLALRLAFSLGYWVGKPLTHDELEYFELARNLTLGRGFQYDPQAVDPDGTPAQQFGRAPGYPFFLSVISGRTLVPAMPVSTPMPIKAAQSVIGAACILLIAVIATRTAGAGAGAIAATIAAVYPPLVWISAYALSETLYSALALVTVVITGSVTDRASSQHHRGTIGRLIAAGLVTGIAILTRPVMLLFAGLAGLWIARRHTLRGACIFLGAALVCVAPWTTRNVLEHGRLILVASDGGVTFWTGNHPLARGEGDLAANPQIKRADREFRRRHATLSAEELEPLYYREALGYIAAHPIAWLWLVVRKFFYLWVPIGPSYTLHSQRYLIASVVAYGSVLPFALGGFLILRRREVPPYSLWLLAGSAVLSCLIFFPQERFRIPVLDPTLIVCASVFFADRWSRRLRS